MSSRIYSSIKESPATQVARWSFDHKMLRHRAKVAARGDDLSSQRASAEYADPY